MAKSGVPVRGVCREGHVIETVSAAGRVTWRGSCPTEGCKDAQPGRQVVARRIPTSERTTTAGSQPAKKPKGRVRKVRAYAANDSQQEPGFDDDPRGGPDGDPGGDRAGVPEPTDQDSRPAGPDSDDSHQPERRPGWRDRLRQRRQRRREPNHVDEGTASVIPGIY